MIQQTAFDRPQGYIHVYTGNGKGKTTAALGLALRASGAGLKTFIAQFLKSQYTSELATLHKNPLIEVQQFGNDNFTMPSGPGIDDISSALVGLEKIVDVFQSGEYDLVVLDEVNMAVAFGLLKKNSVINLINNRPKHIDLVLTGRYAPNEFIEMADLVTEMKEIKHYYNQGVFARTGIEN